MAIVATFLAQSGSSAAQAPVAFAVPSTANPFSTGITLDEGDQVTITASGLIGYWSGSWDFGDTPSPDGFGTGSSGTASTRRSPRFP
jgi:hypothetical protein